MRLPKETGHLHGPILGRKALVDLLGTSARVVVASKRVAAFDYLYPNYLHGPRLTFISMRDPVDRLYPHYNYIKGTKYAAARVGRA